MKEEAKEELLELGQVPGCRSIRLLSIIGEIEGHECLPSNSKTTKYEHVLPQLAQIEEDEEIRGLLILLNTVGGDVEAGLAIAEMIASISKLRYPCAGRQPFHRRAHRGIFRLFFIVKTGTMVIHPVRMSGTVIGAPQTYEYFRQMQDRIISFVAEHSRAGAARLEQMMMNTSMLTKDLGTILVGEEAVKEGLIDAVGGISHAVRKLRKLCRQGKKV